mmetsp:Transcript_42102/g.98174  ORF Transcript_42102/g.98174 Transcript_42102/m.98174 type:complete len:281 (+) Transcript_42102:307-1149(+)
MGSPDSSIQIQEPIELLEPRDVAVRDKVGQYIVDKHHEVPIVGGQDSHAVARSELGSSPGTAAHLPAGEVPARRPDLDAAVITQEPALGERLPGQTLKKSAVVGDEAVVSGRVEANTYSEAISPPVVDCINADLEKAAVHGFPQLLVGRNEASKARVEPTPSALIPGQRDRPRLPNFIEPKDSMRFRFAAAILLPWLWDPWRLQFGPSKAATGDLQQVRELRRGSPGGKPDAAGSAPGLRSRIIRHRSGGAQLATRSEGVFGELRMAFRHGAAIKRSAAG